MLNNLLCFIEEDQFQVTYKAVFQRINEYRCYIFLMLQMKKIFLRNRLVTHVSFL